MTRRWLLLKLLEDAGERGVTTGEILAAGVGSRYSARLLELREAGHVVEGVRVRDGEWRYTLVWSPDVEVGRGNGLTPQSSEDHPPSPAVISPSPTEPEQDTLFTAAVQSPDTAHWRAA